jgi:PAS domain S-box-containing protein
MGGPVDWLFDTTGFAARQADGGWSRGLIWLHVVSDLLIWLAYLSIPIVLAYFAWNRRDLPFRRLFLLFAAFILACGFTHFVEAIIFQTPVYRLYGVLKALTAVVSWVTVAALIPTVPRALRFIDQVRSATATLPAPRPDPEPDPVQRYGIAVVAAGVAVLARGLIDSYLDGDQVFVIALLAVVAVSWYAGFGPGLLTLGLSMTGIVSLFVLPELAEQRNPVSTPLAIGLTIFCGVGAATLGEAQRQARRRAERTLAELTAANVRLIETRAASAESLAQLEAFLANAPVGMAFYDTDLKYVRVNPFLAEGNGATVEGLVGRRLSDAQPDTPPQVIKDLRAVLESDEAIRNREVVRTGRINRVWLSNYFPVRTADGRSLGVGVVTQDITGRRSHELALRESEEKFRSLADSVPHLAWMANPDGHIHWYNRRWYEYTGTTPADMEGWGWQKVHDPAVLPRVLERWTGSLATGEPFDMTFPLRGADGTFRPFLTRVRPVRDEAGAVVRWVGTNTDMTEQQRVEAELRESAERFRTLAEAVPQMVWVTDPVGRVTHVNQRWSEYTGIPSDEAYVQGWERALYPDDRVAAARTWQAALTDPGDRFSHEYRVLQADGQYRWALAVAVPVRGARGRVVQWVGTLTDIHDQKRQAEVLTTLVKMRTAELEAANGLLREEVAERARAEHRAQATAVELGRSNEELEKFAYVASHDLQEPLRKIQAFGDRLGKKYKPVLGADGQEYVERMQAAATRMRRLIDDLLTFSRVTSKAQPFTETDIGELVEDALSDLEVRITHSGGKIDVGPMPTVRGDPSQLRQLFLNLLGNALKFHRKDVSPEVTVRAVPWAELPGDAVPPRPGGRGYRITVADNGIGFEQDYAERMFEVFQRLHGRGEYEGTGIGLAICRKIVQRHGGEITARGLPGRGATFIIDVPAAAG